MSRRTLTLLLAGLLAVGLTATAAVARVPYVALEPGPMYNTLGEFGGEDVIQISGRDTFPTDGHLDLTTVGVRSRLTLVEAIGGWFASDLAVVPREVVFPPGRTDEQVNEQNVQAMRSSQDTATTAALQALGVPSTTEVVVRAVNDGAPAEGELEPGDVLTSVDGRKVTSSKDLAARISARTPGDPVRIGYLRDGKAGEATLTTARATVDGDERAVIGVATGERQDFPVDVTITLKSVGGPSAGLMFALGIIDKLGPESLTDGNYIAGTGTIAADGTVGPIGGISQKLLAAEQKGADAFLVPAGNCAEALASAPDGLRLLRAATLDEALEGLEALREGGQPPSCEA